MSFSWMVEDIPWLEFIKERMEDEELKITILEISHWKRKQDHLESKKGQKSILCVCVCCFKMLHESIILACWSRTSEK